LRDGFLGWNHQVANKTWSDHIVWRVLKNSRTLQCQSVVFINGSRDFDALHYYCMMLSLTVANTNWDNAVTHDYRIIITEHCYNCYNTNIWYLISLVVIPRHRITFDSLLVFRSWLVLITYSCCSMHWFLNVMFHKLTFSIYKQ